MRTVFGLCATMALLTACGQADNQANTTTEIDAQMRAGQISDGQSIVEAECTTCHAVGTIGESPRLDAPPLRYVLSNYDPEALAEDFREGIHVGHPDMPDFDFGPQGTDAVIAYLQSIQVDQPAAE